MKKFKFRLQRVLHLRKQHKDQVARELYIANAKVSGIELDIQTTRREFEANLSPEGESGAGEFLLRRFYSARLESRLKSLALELEDAKKEAIEALSRYREASKELKALEVLQDRKRREHEEAFQRHEQAQLDEFATLQNSQRKSQGVME